MALSIAFFLTFYDAFCQREADSLIQKLSSKNLPFLDKQLLQLVDYNFLKKFISKESDRSQLLNSFAEKAIAATSRWEKGKRAIVLARMGEVLVREHTGGKGYTYIGQAHDLVKGKPGPEATYTYFMYAETFKGLNRLDSAIYYAGKALEQAELLKEDSTIKRSLEQMGNLCYKAQFHSKSAFYYKKLVNHPLSSIRDKRGFLNTIGLTFRNRKLHDSAVYYFERSLKYSIELKDTTWIGLLHGNIGYSYFLQKDYGKALPGLLVDSKYSLKKKNKMSAISALHSIVEIYLTQNKMKLAKQYYDTMSHYFRGEKNSDIQLDYYKASADFYQKANRPDSAVKFLQLYLTLNDSLNAQQYNLNAAQLESLFEFDRQVAQIKELERFNAAQSKENALKNYFLLTTIVIIALAGGLIYGQYRNNKFKNETNGLLRSRNEQIEFQADHLNKLNATKDKLFAIIGHDLRGPINSLKGLMNLVKKQMISKDEFEVFLVKLQNNVEQVHLMLNNLLLWSGSQLNGLKSKPEPIAIKSLVAENFELLHEEAMMKKIALENQVDAETRVLADPDHLRLVLRNLVGNAIKFTNNGGRITVNSNSENEKVIITVKDTGIGMSEETKSHIFQSAASYSTSGTDGEKGTGLGLFLCKEVIEKNGGTIWADSGPNGTSMKFSLPVAQ
ncbi:hypothetical protein WSM22_30990 [Cytophagales bacterium WSM2-2]|nr:hypothetical protein WSM22_30990 [Cytophagales bacterium WSM2-2]